MKTILNFILLIFVLSCTKTKEINDYTIISGIIKEPIEGRELRLYPIAREDTIVHIKVNEDGSFRDTLRFEKPKYFEVRYFKNFMVYLKNGMDLKLTIRDSLVPGYKFSGEGYITSEFLNDRIRMRNELLGPFPYTEFLSLNKDAYEDKIASYINTSTNMIEEVEKELDTAFVNDQKKDLSDFRSKIQPLYDKQQRIMRELAPGMPSPEFTDFINYQGGNTSLKDFRGNYVYIDFWATWCKPCIAEIPYLKKIQEDYKDKNIVFVGISLDEKSEEQKWKDMIKDKEMGGIQLWAATKNDIEFANSYNVQTIPRFVLLDPKGKIVDREAPSPSDAELRKKLNQIFDN